MREVVIRVDIEAVKKKMLQTYRTQRWTQALLPTTRISYGRGIYNGDPLGEKTVVNYCDVSKRIASAVKKSLKQKKK